MLLLSVDSKGGRPAGRFCFRCDALHRRTYLQGCWPFVDYRGRVLQVNVSMAAEWLARPLVDAAWRLEVLDVPWHRATCFLTQWPAIGRGVHSTHDTHLHSSSRDSSSCRETSTGCWQADRFWTHSLGGKLRIAPCRRERLREACRTRRSRAVELHTWDASGRQSPSPGCSQGGRRQGSRRPRTTGHRLMEVGNTDYLAVKRHALSTALAFCNL